MNIPKFKAKRFDNGEWVEGYYFKAPLTDENSGTAPDAGWFFLVGEDRHCISDENGVVYVVDPTSITVVGYNTAEVLLEVQEEMTGMSKLGYTAKDIIKWATRNVEENTLDIICEDIVGMDLEEVIKYLTDWKEELKKVNV